MIPCGNPMSKFAEGPGNAPADITFKPKGDTGSSSTFTNSTVSGAATIDDLKNVFIASASNEEEGKEAFDNFMMMIYRSIIRKLR
jgi:hypothetical protein